MNCSFSLKFRSAVYSVPNFVQTIGLLTSDCDDVLKCDSSRALSFELILPWLNMELKLNSIAGDIATGIHTLVFTLEDSTLSL